jgi:heptosyltransferase-2
VQSRRHIWFSQRWFQGFAEVANWFYRIPGVIIFGGKSEIDIADEIYKKMYPNFRTSDSLVNMAGKTSLRELISLISECDVFLTNDSGPLHIAYAARTPLVALFGSTAPELTGPPPEMNGDSHVVITPICRAGHFERTCRIMTRCMYAINQLVYVELKILPDRLVF